MSHMNWIYIMVQDNSFPLFKEMTEQCLAKNITTFYWNESEVDVIYAKHVCSFVETQIIPDYEEHLISSNIDNQGGIL